MVEVDATRHLTTGQGATAATAQGRAALILESWIADLPPAAFAMVMATAVLAIATQTLEMSLLASVLGVIGIGAYGLLWLLFVARVVRHPRRVFGDIVDHVRGPGYFTIVAATCVLALQVQLLWGARDAAVVLGVVGVFLWVVVMYLVFTAFTIKRDKPSLAEGLTGAWLIAVVATQSLAVLMASLAPTMAQPARLELNFVAVSLWLFGGMLYIWMISLIFYRYTFFRLAPQDLTPPYWINMGAMAISALGGSVLSLSADAIASPFLDATLPFLKGFTVFFWATGTWWIPMLVILAVWRHVVQRFPLRYDTLYWGAVFPLGMYALATLRLAEVAGLYFLLGIANTFVYIALAAWLATFYGMARSLVRTAVALPAQPDAVH